MDPDLSLMQDGEKFMWDGCCYATQEEAVAAGKSYRDDNFQIYLVENEGRFFVYTRRVVKEVAVTTQ